MIQVIVMGSSFDIYVDADLTTTEAAVNAFLIGRGRYEVDSRVDGKIVVTPLPEQGIDRRKLAERMKAQLNEQFADQPMPV